MDPYVKLEIKDGIGTIEFFHPQSNSLPSAILQKLANTITVAGRDKNVLVVILKSGGGIDFNCVTLICFTSPGSVIFNLSSFS